MRAGRLANGMGVALGLALLSYDRLAFASDPKLAALMFIALSLSVCVLFRVRADRLRLGWSALFACLSLAGVAFSFAWGLPSGALALVRYGAALVIALSISQIQHDAVTTVLRVVATTLCLGDGFCAVMQWASGAHGMHLHGTEGNPDLLGLVLAMSLAIVAFESADPKAPDTPVRSLFRYVALGLGALGLGLCHARWAWVSLALAIAWTLVFAQKQGVKRWVGRLALVLGLVVAGASVQRVSFAHQVAAHAPPKTEVVDSGASYKAPASVALRGRLAIATDALSAARTAFPWGAGLGRFDVAWLRAQGERLRAMPPAQAARDFVDAGDAHNQTLQLAAESGAWVAASWWVAMFIAGYRMLQQRAWERVAFLAALAIESFAITVFESPAACVLLGLAMVSVEEKIRWSVASRWVLGLCVMISGWGLSVSARNYLASRYLSFAQEHLELRNSSLRKAIRLSPERADVALAYGQSLAAGEDCVGARTELQRAVKLGDVLAAPIALAVLEAHRGDIVVAEALLSGVLALHPGSFRAHFDRASILTERSRYDDAEAELAVARRLSPGHPMLEALTRHLREARMSNETQETR